jgi:hypothetical protein
VLSVLFTDPEFEDAHAFETIRERFYRDGVAFVENCTEQDLIDLTQRLGVAVRPRNEKTAGSCVSSIRCAPDLRGKAYTSDGKNSLYFTSEREKVDPPFIN